MDCFTLDIIQLDQNRFILFDAIDKINPTLLSTKDYMDEYFITF